MGKLAEFAAKLFGGAGTSAPKNLTASELHTLITGGASAGVAVSENSAMMTSAVYASVGLIGGAVASLPFHIYKRTPNGRERYDTDLWWLFNESPSEGWTSAAAWQYTLQSILLKGDSFWMIERTRYDGRILGFKPYHPDKVQITKDVNGKRVYLFGDERIPKYADDVLHFTGLGFDGERSLTPIQYALRNAAGTSLAADQYAGTFFRGGARPDHAIEVPADVRLSPEQREQLKESWGRQRDIYASNGNTPVLTGGMKVVQLTLNAEDAQLLQTRQYGVEEIARIFGVPPHMIGKTDASTSWGSGIEQMSIGFVRYTLRRHLDAIQQEINRKLWPKSRLFFGEFNTDALLDGDSKAQADYFTKALGGPGSQGWMTINEVRKLKNLAPVTDGDKVIQSGNTPAPAPAPDGQAQALRDLTQRFEAMASKPSEAPVINVNPTINVDNKLPELPAPVTNITNEVNVPEQAAPVVNVENTVNVPETQVNVEAVMPEQAAPTVNIAPSVVNVNPKVDVNLPTRKTETTIERDRQGNIVKATQIEEDAQ